MAEVWDLYSEERKKTGTILRGAPIPRGQYHLVVSAWIVNSKGQYLLSQRHPNKTYPYFWECTGGCVLAGEDSLNGALREVREELGITLEGEAGGLIYQARREKTQDFYDVWLFRADIDTAEMTLQETEVVAVQWVNRERLFDLYRRGELHPLLDYIHEVF